MIRMETTLIVRIIAHLEAENAALDELIEVMAATNAVIRKLIQK